MADKHPQLLSTIVGHADTVQQVRKSEMLAGDRLYVKTHNSLYAIHAVANGSYEVRGGWFDRNGRSDTPITIRGCTWGGTAIKVDVVAACGLHIEFGNKVVTSPIEKIFHFSFASCN